MAQRITRSLDRLTQVIGFVIALLLFAMVVIMFCSVFYRYVLNAPLGWADQMSQWIFVWLVYLGVAAGYRMRIYIGVDVIVKRLKPSVRKGIAVAVDLAIGFFLVVVAYYGSLITLRSLDQVYGSLELPPSYMYAAGPVSATIMLLFVLDSLRLRLIGKHPEEQKS